MKEIKKAILGNASLDEVLLMLRTFASQHPQVITGQLVTRLDDLCADYERMCDYMLRGYRDDSRDNLYHHLLRKAWRLACDWELRMLCASPSGAFRDALQGQTAALTSHDDIRQMLESYVQDMALASLDQSFSTDSESHSPSSGRVGDKADLQANHVKHINQVFATLLLSPQWSRGDAAFYSSLLLSPTIDTGDARTLVSAIMLAAMTEPDPYKMQTLIDLYEQSTDNALRQRALVGAMFSMPVGLEGLFPEYAEQTRRLTGDEATRRQLLELQMQVFLCMNADQDDATIRRDIMPGLMKNQNFRITRFGIEEKERDVLEDILHPDAEDKAMEELEANVKKMLDMQKNGADIYFGGFSQMKRYPFFYTLSNWFTPFTAQHPGLRHVVQKSQNARLLNLLMAHAPLCDSDKYSFALAAANIIDRLPPGLLEAVQQQDDALGEMLSDAQIQEEPFLRRFYLQDLFRFFRLHMQKASFPSPFDYDRHPDRFFFANPLLAVPEMEPQAQTLQRFLLKHRQWQALKSLLSVSGDTQSAFHHHIAGLLALQVHDYDEAQQQLEQALQLQPDDPKTLSALAQAAFHTGNFLRAEACYQQLLILKPSHQAYELSLAIAQVNTSHIQEGMNTLHRLHFEDPDNMAVRRALAWGHLLQSNLPQAWKHYQELLANGHADDRLNAAYCQWFSDDTQQAVELLRDYLQASADPRQQLASDFANDGQLLRLYNISPVEQRIMIDLVCQKNWSKNRSEI